MRETEADRRCAVITGVNGQDGSYMADLLLAHGYRVVGTVRDLSSSNLERITHLRDRIELLELDLLNHGAMRQLLETYRPSEIYNFAARASSTQLHTEPLLTAEYNGLAVVYWLEAIRLVAPAVKFCQASSSEMFGDADSWPQHEKTAFRPRNAYGAAKLFAHHMIGNYRKSSGLFACSAILFNHESPRRGHEFVTRKVTTAAARIRAGLQSQVELGDLDARRDWGYAADYVRAMWLMLQSHEARDFVVATGKLHSVRELCAIAFSRVGLDYREHVVASSNEKRAVEAVPLCGDPTSAREHLGWSASMSFADLIEMMVESELIAATMGES